ncbi:hypothetical protein [Metallibacterium scheffleri]
MQLRTSKLTLALSALLALGLVSAGGYALAAPPAPGMHGPGMAAAQGQWGHGAWGHGKPGHGRGMQGWMHRPGPGMQARFAAMRDMRVLQHLYLAQGRRGDAEAMYHDVLAHTRDPGLRNFAYGQLARLQMMPTDTGAAIATLRKALDENLQQIKPPAAPAS